MKAKASLTDALKQATDPKPEPRVSGTRHGKVGILLYVAPEKRRALKVIAAQRDTSLHNIGVQALDQFLERHDG